MFKFNSTQGAQSATSQDVDQMRRQAKQRFIGAAALLLIAIIVLPFLLSAQPRPLPSNLSVEIASTPDSASAVTQPAVTTSSEQPIANPSVSESVSPSPASTPAVAPAVVSTSQPATQTTATSAAASAPAPVTPSASSSNANSSKVYYVQAGSYSDSSKLREAQAKLNHAGIKYFTQAIQDKSGNSRTRLRVGPFETQNQANSQAARIAKLGLKTIVVKPS